MNAAGKRWLPPAMAAACVLMLTLCAPDLAMADNEIIEGSSPGLDIGKWPVKLLYDLVHGAAGTMLQWASEFWGIIAQGKFVGGDLSSFPDAEAMVRRIIEQVVQPVAQGCLGVCLAIELLRIEHSFTKPSERNLGLGGFEQIIFFGIKYAVLYMVVSNIYTIMYAIFSIFNWMTVRMQSLMSVTMPSTTISPGMLDATFTTLTYDDGGMLLILLIMAGAVLIVTAWTALYAQVLAISRIFEIFIMIAFAAIPATTFANKTLSSIGMEFTKTFCGACLQLAIIYAIVGIGGPIITGVSATLGSLFTSTTTGIDVLMAACVPITSAIALYMMLKNSRTLANKVFGILF